MVETVKNAEGGASARPTVSIVIPAYQSARTLDRALDSLRAQTFADWETIVVDDGSSDGTFEVAERQAARDPRIRAFRQENKGASAARNRGLAECRGRWIGFLDSDDWFDKTFLQTLLDLAARHPDADVVYCDFAMANEAGDILEEQRVPPLDKPFDILAHACSLSVHCALTKAATMARAGNFDETLEINEDWDLWQRIARVGARFVGVPEILAFYYNRPGSLSRRVKALAVDGFEVIRRACAPDPRIEAGDERLKEGLAPEERLPLQFDWLVMCASHAIAARQDAIFLLDLLPDIERASLLPADAAETFFGGLVFGLHTSPEGVAELWPGVAGAVDAFWLKLGERLGPDQKRAVDTARFLVRSKAHGAANAAADFVSDVVHVARVDLDKPVQDIDAAGREAAIVEIVYRDALVGLVEMPAPAVIPASVVIEQIVASAPFWPERKEIAKRLGLLRDVRFWASLAANRRLLSGWGVKARLSSPGRVKKQARMRLRRFLLDGYRGALKRRLRAGPSVGDRLTGALAAIAAGERDGAVVAAVPGLASARKAERPWRDVKKNSPEYWDQVFEEEDPWAYDSAYEQTKYDQTLAMVGPERPARALELACAEGHFSLKLAGAVDSLVATDISSAALERAKERCASRDNIAYQQLDFFNNPIPDKFDLIVCSEVLYEAGAAKRLNAIARNIADHLNPGGALVMAHILEVSEDRARTGFDWNGVFGALSIERTFSAIEGLQLEARAETELYHIHRFRKTDKALTPQITRLEIGAPPEPEYASYIAWGGLDVTLAEAARERAVAVPILMYHRIAPHDDGPAGLSQYRVSPEDFEQQLRWLRRNGYHAISADEWLGFLSEGRPLAGRPVILTFDDGYRDFADNALPLLGRYGMTATLGVVTDKVGGRSDWDAGYGETAPLMDWREIRMAQEQGVTIASHSASHRALPAIGATEALREAFRSSAAIAKATGVAPSTIIYPYGAYDALAARAFAMAGYRIGVGTHEGASNLVSDPMHLPRIAVNGFDDLDAFVRALTKVDQETGLTADGEAQ